MKALIDADSLIYKVGFAIEEKNFWNEYEVTHEGAEPDIDYTTDLEQCYESCSTLIENIMFSSLFVPEIRISPDQRLFGCF